MISYMEFWLARVAVDLLLFVGVIVAIVVGFLIWNLPKLLRRD